MHTGDAPGAALEASQGLACVRCERTSTTATRVIGRLRLVLHHTICISCFNRQREILAGSNSKGARPVKWAGLKPTVITIKESRKKRREDIGLTMGYGEAKRHAERRWPECELLKVEIDGEIVEPVEPVALVEVPAVSEPQVKTKWKRAARRKPLPVATDAEAFENDDETVLNESAPLEIAERFDSEPVTPTAEIALIVEPSQPLKVTVPPAVAPIRLFSRQLVAMGFQPKTLYGSGKPGTGTLMPLAHDLGGKILVGCTCSNSFTVHHKRLLRGLDCPSCGSVPPARMTFADYLRERSNAIIFRNVQGSTHEHAIAGAVRAHCRTFRTTKP